MDNKYVKEFQGDSLIDDGITYKFDRELYKKNKITGELKVIKYRYIPAPTENQKAQLLIQQKQEEERTYQLARRLALIDNKEIIKKVNRAYKGKIEGKSSVSSSIYSKITVNGEKLRIRVSKHDVYTKRSESDISVVVEAADLYINHTFITSFLDDQTPKQVENMVFKKIQKFIEHPEDY